LALEVKPLAFSKGAGHCERDESGAENLQLIPSNAAETFGLHRSALAEFVMSGLECNHESLNFMDIRSIVTGESHELLVAGRIDGAGANQLEEEILKAIRAEAKTIYVNLSGATFLCSAGLRVLLQYWRQMKNSGRALLASRPSPEVDSVLSTSGFRELIVEKI
jgi:anti-sigma B factor antagonist/stage II sporulation protein AA (anti-sigma F factor antagonist)